MLTLALVKAFLTAFSLSRPFLPPNTQTPEDRRFCASSTLIAAWDSGTRCSRRIFIRSAGTVHVREAISTSLHLAPKTSDVLPAVSTRKANAALAEGWQFVALTKATVWEISAHGSALGRMAHCSCMHEGGIDFNTRAV